MKKEILTMKFDLKEAFILFKLMGFDSFIGYTNPFVNMDSDAVEKELSRIKNNLLFNGTLIESNGRLCIEPSTFSVLQACKLTENILWLQMSSNHNIVDSYFYISSRQIIEVVENIESGIATIEFNVTGDLTDFFEEIQFRFTKFNPIINSTEKYKTQISDVTYQNLLNVLNELSNDDLVNYLMLNEHTSQSFAESLIYALKTHSIIGHFEVIRKVEGTLNGFRFVLSNSNVWILTQLGINENLLDVQNGVTLAQFLNIMFETFVESFKHKVI